MQALRDTTPLRIEKNFDMPSIPLVLIKIIQLLEDEGSSAHQLEELILHDPPLTARLLRLANSAFYSFRHEVKTISHATALLGTSLVKSLAIGVEIFDLFTKGMKSEATLVNHLWMHSFGVGLLAQAIWTPRSSRKEGEFAFLCGLLHDIGKAVYFKKDAVGYSSLFSREKLEGEPEISIFEFERYGADHATVGSMLTRGWGLPPQLSTVIEKQRDPLDASMPLVGAVTLADLMAKHAGIGHDGDSRIHVDLMRLRSQLKMGDEEYGRLGIFAKDKLKDVQEFFRIS